MSNIVKMGDDHNRRHGLQTGQGDTKIPPPPPLTLLCGVKQRMEESIVDTKCTKGRVFKSHKQEDLPALQSTPTSSLWAQFCCPHGFR